MDAMKFDAVWIPYGKHNAGYWYAAAKHRFEWQKYSSLWFAGYAGGDIVKSRRFAARFENEADAQKLASDLNKGE